MQAEATPRSDRIGASYVLAPDFDDEALRALGPHEVEILLHLWSLLALAEHREGLRRSRPGGGYVTEAEKHKAQHGHFLGLGCCA